MTTTEPSLRPTDHDDSGPAPTGPTEGHLLVRRGLGRTTIATDHGLPELYAARFAGPAPRRDVRGGTLELTYPLLSFRRRGTADALTLTGAIPWRIEVHGGVLPTPVGTLPVRLGSVDDVTISRPAGVAVRVSVRRGARSLRVDDQVLGAVGGPTVLATPGYEMAPDRLDIAVDAARRLTVTTRPNR